MTVATKPHEPAHLTTIPFLQGESNFVEWKHYTLEQARYYGLEAFIEGTAEEPFDKESKVQFTRQRSRAMSLITKSIGKAWNDVVVTGWDPETEKDPKVLWILLHSITKKLPLRSATQLLDDIANACMGENETLWEFNVGFHRTCMRLAEKGIVLPDKVKVIFMIKGLKERFPTWHDELKEEFEEGKLTWGFLQARIRHASWLKRHHHLEFTVG